MTKKFTLPDADQSPLYDFPLVISEFDHGILYALLSGSGISCGGHGGLYAIDTPGPVFRLRNSGKEGVMEWMEENVPSPTKSILDLALKGLLIVTLSIWITPTLSHAVNFPIPTHGVVTHFDLNPGAAFDLIPAFPGVPAVPAPVTGGPCGAFVTGEFCFFGDGLFSGSLWHWETEITNVNAAPVVFPVGFFFPNGGGPIIGLLGLGAGSTFQIDIHVQDFPPEFGPWAWAAFSGLPFPIGIDTSVTENLITGPEFPGQFNFFFHSNGDDFFNLDPTLTPELRFEGSIVPEPATVLLFGSGLAWIFAFGRKRLFQGKALSEKL